MANEAYRVLRDTSIPQALRKADELVNGEVLYETVGRSYDAGSVVFAEEITPPIRERVENGELEHMLEPISREEAERYRAQSDVRTLVPEHEQEAEVFRANGDEIVSREAILQLNAQGADGAKDALEAAKEEGNDERPALSAPPTPDLAEASREGTTIVPEDEGTVEVEVDGPEIPEGVEPTHVIQTAEVRARQNSAADIVEPKKKAKRSAPGRTKREPVPATEPTPSGDGEEKTGQ